MKKALNEFIYLYVKTNIGQVIEYHVHYSRIYFKDNAVWIRGVDDYPTNANPEVVKMWLSNDSEKGSKA